MLGGGRYRLTLDLPMAGGGWPLTVHVQSPDGREASIELDYKTGIPVRLAGASGGAGNFGVGDPRIAYHTCLMHLSVRPSSC